MVLKSLYVQDYTPIFDPVDHDYEVHLNVRPSDLSIYEIIDFGIFFACNSS